MAKVPVISEEFRAAFRKLVEGFKLDEPANRDLGTKFQQIIEPIKFIGSLNDLYGEISQISGAIRDAMSETSSSMRSSGYRKLANAALAIPDAVKGLNLVAESDGDSLRGNNERKLAEFLNGLEEILLKEIKKPEVRNAITTLSLGETQTVNLEQLAALLQQNEAQKR